MNKEQVIKNLRNIVGESNIKIDEPMKKYTSFKVGGPADILVEPKTKDELVSVIKHIRGTYNINDSNNVDDSNNDNDSNNMNDSNDNNDPTQYIILGNGSNTIIRDGGFRGVVIVIGQVLSKYKIEGTKVTADAGILLSTLAKKAANAGLTGMEPVSGIPGSLGGAVFMNAGAYGGEMKDILESVTTYDPLSDKTETVAVEDMDLGYRHSVFQTDRRIILDVTLNLNQGDKKEIKNKMAELNAKRNAKQPVNMPSAGSFFKRPKGNFAGTLIEDAGLKGQKMGGAQISELHAGFMVNAGGATSQDIENLMQIVIDTVYQKFGVTLEPEVRFVGEVKQ